MPETTHYIRHQVLEINCLNEDLGEELLSQASYFFERKIKAGIYSVLNEMNQPGRQLKIDHVLLEVSILPDEWAGDRLVAKIMEELHYKLGLIIKKQKNGYSFHIDKDNEEHASRGAALQSVPKNKDLFEALLFYLSNGYLPWSKPNAGFIDWIRSAKCLPKWRSKEIQELQKVLSSKPDAITRIVNLLTDQGFVNFLKLLTRSKDPGSQNLISEGQLFLENSFVEIRKRLKISSSVSQLNELEKEIKLSLAVGVFPDAILKRLLNQLSDADKNWLIDKMMIFRSTNFMLQNRKQNTGPTPDEGDSLQVKPGNKNKLLLNYFDNRTISYKKNEPKEHLSNVENQFYIQNAGLSLTYPFIPHYLKTLGLLDQEECFVHPEAQQKAVLLLHYLIWSHRPATEGELVLNKILCGLSLSKAIDLNISISRQEKQEGQKMLEALISNWPALGSTNVEGLTESFLKRDGKLNLEKGKFRLTVNQAGIDVLLSKLDWSLNLIRLPFMKELIFIDW